MDESSRPVASPVPTASASKFVATFAVILATIAVLFVADTSLARVMQLAFGIQAASSYDQGVALLGQGKAAAAADRFATAHAMERDSATYELALARALAADGRLDEAKTTLVALLSRAQTDGQVNLEMARVLRREGQTDDAKSYYHRAIYGQWPRDSTRSEVTSRLELIDLLAAQQATPELLAELLPLEDLMRDSLALRRRVGHLFLIAGSPARAATVFRALLRQDGNDADAFDGMGQAELALGNFRTARVDLAKAVRLAPSDTGIASRLALADSALALDPMERGLDAHQRYGRARDVMTKTIAAAKSCVALPPGGGTMADSARYLLGTTMPPKQEAAASDELLGMANGIYGALPAPCVAHTTFQARLLRLVQARLPQ